jgi:acyl-coenzyme A synthetase/AMP-(fatty) acid ligase
MSVIETILNEELRVVHSSDKSLGAGNFLHKAAALSPYKDQAQIWMDRPCKIFTGEVFPSFSLTELKHVVDTYASWYYGVGVRAKDPIAIYVSEGVENLIHYLALNAIGAIPAIVNGNMPPDIAAKWIEKIGALGVYSDASHGQELAKFAKGNSLLRFFVTDETAAKVFRPGFPDIYPYQHSPADPVLIGHSSGTTGIPKAVQFQHEQFFYGIRYRLSLPFPKGSEKVLSALPHSHSAGIAYVMLAVLSGCHTMILSSNRPEVVLPSVQLFQPTMVVAFPETYVLLNEADLDAYDLSSIQLWFNGGDAAHEAHIRRLIQKGHHLVEGVKQPGSVFIDGLGSSEMGFSLFRNVHTLATSNYNRCIGKPLDWVDAAVLGENGERLPPYRVGKLGVKSPTITPGYWNDSALTARSQVNGYFLTGDMFYQDENGRFFHVDRIPDVIKTTGGPVYSLETEEFLIKNFSLVSDCTVVAAPGENGAQVAVVVVRLKKGEVEDSETLLASFNQELLNAGKRPLGGLIFGELTDIPLGPTGKVLKRELREYFRELFARPAPTSEPLHA